MTHSDEISPVEMAAAWLADQPAGNRYVIGDLKQRFTLSAKQACEAIAQANKIRADRTKP